MSPPVRTRRLLRAALLALLVLGMVISPTLAVVSGLHGIEHAALAANGHGHGHGHADDAGRHDHAGDRSDADHATGAHGLLHHGCSLSVALPHAGLSVSEPAACTPLLPELRRPCLPGDSPTLPFRPPIA